MSASETSKPEFAKKGCGSFVPASTMRMAQCNEGQGARSQGGGRRRWPCRDQAKRLAQEVAMARRETAGVDDGPVEHTPERPRGREVFSKQGQAADEEGPHVGAQPAARIRSSVSLLLARCGSRTTLCMATSMSRDWRDGAPDRFGPTGKPDSRIQERAGQLNNIHLLARESRTPLGLDKPLRRPCDRIPPPRIDLSRTAISVLSRSSPALHQGTRLQ